MTDLIESAAPARTVEPTPSPRRDRTASRLATLRRVGVPLLFAVVAVAAWQAWITITDAPAYLVPSPGDIVEALSESWRDLLEPTLVTMQEAYGGFLLAAVTGFAIALLMSRWKTMEQGAYPYLVILQTIPIIAVAPILVVWFGAGPVTNTLVAAMLAVFPVAANTLTGLKSTDRNLVQLYRMAGATPRVQLFSLRIPHALPEIMTGLKIASSSAAIGAIVGEFAAGIGGGAGGLGYAITRNANQLKTAELFACVVLASAVALLLFAIITAIEWALLHRWHESATPEDE